MGEWSRLIEEIKNCRKCGLYASRKQAVPGEGSRDSDIMFVGEAPGAKEDEQGRPFVGPAGKLLTQLIESIGYRREDVYITNIVKCRPPGNRDPTEDEIETCIPYLLREIDLVRPKIIVALGRHAARTLFSLAGLKWRNMKALHGRVFDAEINGVKVKLLATYHPAAALYYPKLKNILEKDFNEQIRNLISKIRKTAGFKGEQRTLLDYFSK